MHLAAGVTTTIVLSIMIVSILVYILRRLSENGLPKGQRNTLVPSIILTMLYSSPTVMLLIGLHCPQNPPPLAQLFVTLICFLLWVTMTFYGLLGDS